MRAGHTFYTHTAGYRELREAIAAQDRSSCTRSATTCRRSWPRSAAPWRSTPPSARSSAAATTPSSSPPPTRSFRTRVIMSGGEPRPAPLARRGDRFVLDLDRVRAAIDANTRMLIVNSPSNPTGWVISEDEQRALAEIAERHDLVILADEVYERLVYDGRAIAPSFARVVTNRDRLIVVNSFSKTYNMTGLASGLGANQRAHDHGDVQGRRVHDLESGGDGAAGRHRGASRRRALHRGVARALSAAARSGEGGAVRIFPACRCRIRKAPSTRFRNSTTAPIAPHLRPRWCARPASRWRPASVLAVMAKATSAYVLHPPKPRSPTRSRD